MAPLIIKVYSTCTTSDNLRFLKHCFSAFYIQRSILDVPKRPCFFLAKNVKHLRLRVRLSVPCSTNRLIRCSSRSISMKLCKQTHNIDTARPTSSLQQFCDCEIVDEEKKWCHYYKIQQFSATIYSSDIFDSN